MTNKNSENILLWKTDIHTHTHTHIYIYIYITNVQSNNIIRSVE